MSFKDGQYSFGQLGVGAGMIARSDLAQESNM
jgi:hypothetical protein